MPRRPSRAEPVEEQQAPGGLGGMLRGSVNTMVGAAGLNLPLRAVERLTAAVEGAAAILERLERASSRLDDLDDDFLERVAESVDAVMAMQRDLRTMSAGVERMEKEVHALRVLLSQRAEGDPPPAAPPRRAPSPGGRRPAPRSRAPAETR